MKRNNEIYVVYSEKRYGGNVRDGQEDSDWPDYQDELVDWKIKYCTTNLNKVKEYTDYYETCSTKFKPKKGELYYVVYVRYNTGGSFVKICGAGHIVGVYDNEVEAKFVVDSIEKYVFEGYSPWIGYFEELVSCHCELFRLE